MINNLIVLLLLIGMNYSLFAQTDKKINTELRLAIYKGNAYKKWYRFNVNSGQKIRELEERRLNNKVSQNVLDIIKEKTDKANKKEAKAKVFHAVNIPITFVFHKNKNPELPWTASTVELNNEGVYEDDFFRMEFANIEVQDYTTQNVFRFSAKIINKQVRYLNIRNEWGPAVINVHYQLTVNYDEGKFVDSKPLWSGSVYRAQSPNIYKTDNKTYSFIPFLDRHKEATREKVLEAF